MTGPRQSARCSHWIGAEHRYCEATEGVRLFVTGLACPAHTPNALRGLPEVPPGPGMPAGAWTTPSPLNDSRVHDARAVASGKRRAPEHTYRAAQAAVGQREAS